MRRAVFLDRDGVINRAIVRAGKPFPPDTLDELEILPGVARALERLRAAGFLNIVVTNQPDVATGKQRLEVVESMHRQLQDSLAIDAISACYHVQADECPCRKPRPGMLLDAARRFEIDLAGSFMVGDRWRDVGAGHAAGCAAALFIDYAYKERGPAQPHVLVKSLADAVERVILPALQSSFDTGDAE